MVWGQVAWGAGVIRRLCNQGGWFQSGLAILPVGGRRDCWVREGVEKRDMMEVVWWIDIWSESR